MGDDVIVSVIATGFDNSIPYATKAEVSKTELGAHQIEELVAETKIVEPSIPVYNELLQRVDHDAPLVEKVIKDQQRLFLHQDKLHQIDSLQQNRYELDSLDVPAFLRRPKTEDVYLEPVE